MTQTTETNKLIECPCTTKRGIARHQKLLEVAGKTFLKNGYAGASVNEIVRKAGGSLGTLYQLFGNKLGLFEAVLKVKTCEVFDEFESDAVWTDEIEASLLNFGRRLQRAALSPDGIAIYRLVITENSLDQEHIQKIFYTYGPQKATDILSGYFSKQVKNNRLKDINCKLAAYQFLEMIKAPFYLRLILGEQIDEEELEEALKQGVRLFLNGALKIN